MVGGSKARWLCILRWLGLRGQWAVVVGAGGAYTSTNNSQTFGEPYLNPFQIGNPGRYRPGAQSPFEANPKRFGI